MIGAVQDQSPNPKCAKYNCCGYEDFGSHHFAFRVGFLLSSPTIHPSLKNKQSRPKKGGFAHLTADVSFV